MPRFKTNFTTSKPRPRMPPAFYETRDRFRARGLELWSDSPTRFVCRNDGVVLQVWRSLPEAQAWLADSSAGGRPR